MHGLHAQAENQLRTIHGDRPAAYSRDLVPSTWNVDRGIRDAAGFPWTLETAPGQEEAEHWSLREATGDPLFGFRVPDLPSPPPDPYIGLTPFTAKEAAVFLDGRRRAIADLLGLIESPSTASR